jgi:lipoate-protein ligase A
LSGAWVLERLAGSAAELHHRPLGPIVVRTVAVLEVPRPALVLGSTQADADVDEVATTAQHVEVARRRSGGGAVLLVPGRTLWVDVDLPRDDALWDDDVGRATHWLGRVWVRAVGELGVRASAHTSGMVENAWSRRVCFAGVGPGEVLVDGRKLVGISQRRTRAGARFQCVVHRAWDPTGILGLLAVVGGERAVAATALARAGAGLDVEPASVVDALVDALPA